jgi:hypothetical protein
MNFRLIRASGRHCNAAQILHELRPYALNSTFFSPGASRFRTITDFSNSTGDAVFDDALKTALSVSLRQSPFLNMLSDSEVAKTLPAAQALKLAPASQGVESEAALAFANGRRYGARRLFGPEPGETLPPGHSDAIALAASDSDTIGAGQKEPGFRREYLASCFTS